MKWHAEIQTSNTKQAALCNPLKDSGLFSCVAVCFDQGNIEWLWAVKMFRCSPAFLRMNDADEKNIFSKTLNT
jgi:hypothetical protein